MTDMNNTAIKAGTTHEEFAAGSGVQVNTLTRTDRGVTLRSWEVAVGDYVWHVGAFRRVTAVNETKLRLGRYALKVTTTVEAHRQAEAHSSEV